MNYESIFVTIYLFCALLLSIPLNVVIFQTIAQKPLASQNILDLLYRDCIIYNYFCNLCFSIAVTGCLCSTSLTLNFAFSLTISIVWYFSIFLISLSLSLAGLLRFGTLFYNSLDNGIHFLGQDNQAICVVRIVLTVTSLIFLISFNLFLQKFPGVFYIFYIDQDLTITDIERNNPYTILYIIPSGIAAIINVICRLYEYYLSSQMQEDNLVENTSKKFEFSLGGAILISSQLFVVAFSTFIQRLHRLFVIFPCMLTTNLVFIPLYIIFRNKKIEKMLFEYMSYYNIEAKQFLLNCIRNSNVVTPDKSVF
jgi:hypothetical protein